MMNSPRDADDVADYLRAKFPTEFAGEQLRIIHRKNEVMTNRSVYPGKRQSNRPRKPGADENAFLHLLNSREGRTS